MFLCDQCGLCCRQVAKSDIYTHLDRGDGICKYFDEKTNLCNIYPVRPTICNIDKAYDSFFKQSMSRREYYDLNYAACQILKIEDKVMSDIKSALVEKFEEIFGYTPVEDEKVALSNFGIQVLAVRKNQV